MKVGSIVVCLFDFEPNVYTPNVPVKEGLYVVRALFHARSIQDTKYTGPALLLEEIINPAIAPYKECGFGAERFRELQPPMQIPEELFNCKPETETVCQ